MVHWLRVAVFLGVFFGWAASLTARTWTDSTGKYKVEARLLTFRNGKVYLEKSNGQLLTLPLSRLSRVDQQFVREQFSADTRGVGPNPVGKDNKGIQRVHTRQRWALLIGVNDYSEITDLRFCGNDVAALGKQLTLADYPADHIIVLHDGASDRKYQPFKSNIETQLELLLGRLDESGERIVSPGLVGKGDDVVIALSGHGAHFGGKSYFCPADVRVDRPETFLSLDRLFRHLQSSPANLKLLLVDACRNDPFPRDRKSVASRGTSEEFASALLEPPQGIVVLSSCAPTQVSLEDASLRHGLFMNYVLKGIAGEADLDGDRALTVLELHTFASRHTKTAAARKNVSQTPMLKGELVGAPEIARLAAKTDVGGPPSADLPSPSAEFGEGFPAVSPAKPGLNTAVAPGELFQLRGLKNDYNKECELVFTPDGKRVIASASDGHACWNLANGSLVWGPTYTNRNWRYGHMALSNNGRTLSLVDAIKTLNSIDPSTGKVKASIEGLPGLGDVAWSADDRTILVGDAEKGQLVVIGRTGKQTHRLNFGGKVGEVALNRDGKIGLFVSENRVHVWDFGGNDSVTKYNGHEEPVVYVAASSTNDVALSLAAASELACELRIWDISSKQVLHEQTVGNNVVSVDVSPDWRVAVTGETDGHVYAWDVKTGKELGRVGKHDEKVTNVAISPCGHFAVSRSSDTTIKVWRLPVGG